MKLPTWRDLYEEFLYNVESEVEMVDDYPRLIEGTQFRGEYSCTNKDNFHCWEVAYKVTKTRHPTERDPEQFTETHRYYIWLGRKGSIYSTVEPIPAKKSLNDKLSKEMRHWASHQFWKLQNNS